MNKNTTKTLLISILSVFILSCSDYQKALKSSDYNFKYDKALEYYAKEDYYRAQTLLNELVSIYKGTQKAENVLFCYADCHYKQQDYNLGAYYFDKFAKTYPYSDSTEKAAYTSAYCYYLNSPRSNLDQTDTRKAINAMQLFINKYPNSDLSSQANDIIEKLRYKLEEKAYENSKLYFKIRNYQAANVALKNGLKEFPDSRYREEIMYLIVKSSFLLAEKSVEKKQGERYQNTISEYYTFLDEYPQSKYLKEIEKMYTKSVTKIKNI